MENAFELPAFAVIGEHQLPHRLAIQHAVIIEYCVAEISTNLGQRRCALCHHIARNNVGIDNGYAKVGEKIGDGRFTAGNATGEPDTQRTWC